MYARDELLDAAGFADEAIADEALAREVAKNKNLFFQKKIRMAMPSATT